MLDLSLSFVLLLLTSQGRAQITDPLKYVDQLIGTQAGGGYLLTERVVFDMLMISRKCFRRSQLTLRVGKSRGRYR